MLTGTRSGMQKSRIGGIFIDHPASSFEASPRFWLAATGRELESGAEEDEFRRAGHRLVLSGH
jgi:hypothetical protein